VLINAGILAAYCCGLPYEAGVTGLHIFGGLWCGWWRVMLAAGLLPPVAQVCGCGASLRALRSCCVGVAARCGRSATRPCRG
jgi:hypothetical protein